MFNDVPILVAARSKALVYGRSVAWIAGLNPAGSMNVFRLRCVLSGRRADPWCTGILRSVMRKSVVMKPHRVGLRSVAPRNNIIFHDML